MFTVGATNGRPQTTAKPKRATIGRPYKQISAEKLFSLPIFAIMVLTKSLPPGGSLRTRNRRGMGFALYLRNTKAKSAVKQNDK